MTRRRGHTLLELVVALTVLGIMGTLVAAAWRPERGETRLRQSARALVALLDEARSAAEENGTVVTLILDPATGRVWYAADANDEPPRRAGTLPLAGSVIVEGDSPRLRFVFVPGGLTFGGPVRMHDGASRCLVSIDAWTGVTRVDSA